MYKKLHELAIGDRFKFGWVPYTVYGRIYRARKGHISIIGKNVLTGHLDYFSPDVWVLIS